MGILEWNADLSFSVSMNKYIDEIYKDIYPVKSITRLTRDDVPHILDQKFHIDTIIQLDNGMIITAQEKTRRLKYIKYQEFTLEFTNNQFGKPGEFQKLCTDIYFYGYGEPEKGFECVYIFKPIDVKNAIIKNELKGKLQVNQYHSTASFFAYPFKNFKVHWFIYKRGFGGADYPPVTNPANNATQKL